MAEITAKELAARLGISTAAVSFALNGKPGVSEETRAKVMALAQELGYVHNRLPFNDPARKTLCFLIYVGQTIRNMEKLGFSARFLKGAETCAAEYGYKTVVRYLFSDRPMEAQLKDILSGVNGVIILGTDVGENSVCDIEHFILSAGNTPVVMLDNPLLSEQVDCVLNDNASGAREVARYYVRNGYERIAYLYSKSRTQAYLMRERGFLGALAEAGQPLFSSVCAGCTVEEAYRDVVQWIRRTRQLPDALFADDDMLGIAAIRALRDCGIAVPQQVAVIGYNDGPECEISSPSLSSVQVFGEQMGSWASQIIIKRLRHENSSYVEPLLRVTVSGGLHIRQSCAN